MKKEHTDNITDVKFHGIDFILNIHMLLITFIWFLGTLVSIPLTTVAPRTLNHFTYDLLHLNAKENSDALLVKKLR